VIAGLLRKKKVAEAGAEKMMKINKM